MCEQMLEIIFINGEKETISEIPLLPKSIIEKSEYIDQGSHLLSTSCYRGYLGTWEVKDNKLYLNHIEGIWKLKNNEPVFADWYTGKLHIPGTMYSLSRTTLEIKNGVVIKNDI